MFIVNGLAAELLSVGAGSIDRDRPRFAIRRDSDRPRPGDFPIFHRGDVVGPVVYDFVGGRAPGHIPFRGVGLPIPLADPDAVGRFPILVHAVHGHLDLVPLPCVNDRRVLAHPRHELRLRLIELPRPHLRAGRKTGCGRGQRQNHYCNSSFHHGGDSGRNAVRRQYQFERRTQNFQGAPPRSLRKWGLRPGVMR